MSEIKDVFRQVSNNMLILNTSLCQLKASIDRQQKAQTRPLAVTAMVLLFVSGLLVGHVATEQLTRPPMQEKPHVTASAQARTHP